ncbi:acyltransferase family protein [Microbacterium sp. No. 7]|uniref:acyltransferase family protein n=1 Tax=Microbacterium sp. No. 7 TaxID=1714373 RepID=UPI0006D0D24A|nr:acyltransferase [Microbacterium sp. No. 7]ALJ19080.1 hypothetical protein AOA12_03835 [Microbacterium sp. No. 7]
MTAPPPTATPRLDSLTGVRFLAALLVFGYHGIHYLGEGGLGLFAAGMAGVSLFFLLSGFVMAWSAGPADRAALYYRRRFARIYPAFLAAWLVSLAVGTVGGTVSLWDVLLPPTLLQAWVPLRIAYFAGSAVFWSLSCEAFFYLLFPWIHRLLAHRTAPTLVLVGSGAALASLGTALALSGAPATDLTRWLLVLFPPLRLMEFVIGVVLGIAFRRGLRMPVPLWCAFALAAAGCGVAALAPYALSRYAVTLLPFVVLIGALATADLRGSPSLLRRRPFVELGVWSYCFYLLHAMVLIAVFSVAGGLDWVDQAEASPGAPVPAVRWALLAAALGASVVAAWMLHRIVERPLERLLRPTPLSRLDATCSTGSSTRRSG